MKVNLKIFYALFNYFSNSCYLDFSNEAEEIIKNENIISRNTIFKKSLPRVPTLKRKPIETKPKSEKYLNNFKIDSNILLFK